MVILDTNIVSELTRPNPERKVVAWLDRQFEGQVYLTAITKAEIVFGLECMPAGRRRFELEEIYKRLFLTRFLGRVLPFDDECTHAFARLAASAIRRGMSFGSADLQIAAIALSNGFAVATRNTSDFDHEGLELINPWTD
ncbi:MAG: type II toxin-antitoxin system VapC family toxin [Hyphomicrobiales bacterium]